MHLTRPVNRGLLPAPLLLALLCGLAFGPGCGAQQQNPGKPEQAQEIDAAHGGIKVEDFGEYFSYQPVEAAYVAAEYDLPLDENDILNHGTVTSAFGLSDESQALLMKNGFMVTAFRPGASEDDFVTAYKSIQGMRIPVFVTSGSVLHAYHVLFDDLLSSIEADHLYDDIWKLSLALFEASRETYLEAGGERKQAALRNMAFFAVGLSLLKPEKDQVPAPPAPGEPRSLGFEKPVHEFVPGDLEMYVFDAPGDAAGLIEAELDLIAGHQGPQASPIFIYSEDYSQYVPRGHYTRSAKLSNYFRAMMWYGRMSMLIKGSADIPRGSSCSRCDALISEYDARVQTLCALMIASEMERSAGLMDLWARIYKVTAFFVGFSDDLGPYEYLDVLATVFGEAGLPDPFQAQDYAAVKTRLAEFRSPLIYGGTGGCEIQPPLTPQQADKCLAKTRGFRLMGQRFVPDSYIMSKLVTPHVGTFEGGSLPFTGYMVPGVGETRVFARGLDVMAVLGSRRAREMLAQLGDSNYMGYDRAFTDIKAEIDELGDSAWHQNLYWNWLWTLKGLLSEYGSGRPTFMQSEGWKDRLLNIAMASWAELRHDTILYVKQSYTPMVTSIPMPAYDVGFAEPVPELYNRLLSLTAMTRLGLEAMGLLGPQEQRRLTGLEEILASLVKISVAELRGEEPEPAESEWLAGFGDALERLLGDLSKDSRKTTVIADVHTDLNSGMVLEEASGYVDLMLVAWPVPGGVYLAAGPELSYYEFKHPIADRLTDEAWRRMLETAPPEKMGTDTYFASPK